MKLHHTKHHQAYVNGLNVAEKAYAESTSVREKIVLQSALRFNGGGTWSFVPLGSLALFLFMLLICMYAFVLTV